MGKTKILGLDLGTNSIGWAVLEGENQKANKVIDCGVRIFSAVTNSKTNIPKNQERREARGARILRLRKKNRIKKLTKLLQNEKLIPTDPQKLEEFFYTTNPYEARKKAQEEKLTKQELARVLLHLNQRRGFRSNRKTEFADLLQDPDIKKEIKELIKKEEQEQQKNPQKNSLLTKKDQKDEKKILGEISELNEQLKGKTLGQYLYQQEKKRGIYTCREMYEDEFQTIWEKQKEYYSELLNDSLHKEIYNIIFYQNPLKIQKFLVGMCTEYPKKKKCSEALLEFQEYRIWQDLNNIILNNKDRLSLEEKQKIAKDLQNVKSLSVNKIFKKQGTNIEKSKKFLSGNITNCEMKKHFPTIWQELEPKEQSDFIQDCLSINRNSTLYKRLKKEHDFTPKEAFQFIKLDLGKSGYANLSLKATKEKLVQMKKGTNVYQKGYDTRKQDSKAKILKELPYIPMLTEKKFQKQTLKQEIRNPVIIKALHEIQKVVNALLKKYQKFDYIRVELARDLKNGIKRKKEINEKNDANQKQNKAAEKEGFTSREDKDKYKLWKECNKLCPYTGKSIGLEDLKTFKIEIDHIIPYSIHLDDSFLNKTVCFAEANQKKGNQTPYQAYSGDRDRWEQIAQRINSMKEMRSFKKEKFLMNDEKVEELRDDFTRRHLNDTRYLSKLAMEYLKKLGSTVEVTKGTLTAMLRRILGFSKDRNDHTHHAVDAIMVALTERRLLEQISSETQKYEKNSSVGGRKKLWLPETIKNTFGFSQLEDLVDKIVVSHASTKDKHIQGALHKETARGKKIQYTKEKGKSIKKYCYASKVAIAELTEAQIEKIGDDYVKQLLKQQLEAAEGENVKKKLKTIQAKGLFHKNSHPIKSVRIFENFSPDSLVGIKKGHKDGKLYKYYETSNNHHMIIFENLETKKKYSETITAFEAARRKADKEPIIQKEKKDYKYLLHLKINDMFSLEVENSEGVKEKNYYRVQKFSKGRIIFRKHNRAETDGSCEKIKGKFDKTATTIFDYSPKKLKENLLGKFDNSN